MSHLVEVAFKGNRKEFFLWDYPDPPPLNAAVINSVGAHIRATAIAVNIFIIHILGDVPSPTMMGWVADRKSLQAAFILPVIAMGISSAILFYGTKFAPAVAVDGPKSS